MAKQLWKPGNMLYPLPVVLVTVTDGQGNDNVLTIAWAGTICSDPPMVSISIRPERHSYEMVKETGEFVINLTTEELTYATDYCGVRSGKNEDKFQAMQLKKVAGECVKAPLIEQSPINLECKVRKVESFGTHDVFMADVVAVHANEEYMDEHGKFNFSLANPIVYSHGGYYKMGEQLGTFGYSVRK